MYLSIDHILYYINMEHNWWSIGIYNSDLLLWHLYIFVVIIMLNIMGQ